MRSSLAAGSCRDRHRGLQVHAAGSVRSMSQAAADARPGVRACRSGRGRRAAAACRGRRRRCPAAARRRRAADARRQRVRLAVAGGIGQAFLHGAQHGFGQRRIGRPRERRHRSSSCSAGRGIRRGQRGEGGVEVEAVVLAQRCTTPRMSPSSSSAESGARATLLVAAKRGSRCSARRLSFSAVSLWPATSCSSRDSRRRSPSRALSASRARVASRSALALGQSSRASLGAARVVRGQRGEAAGNRQQLSTIASGVRMAVAAVDEVDGHVRDDRQRQHDAQPVDHRQLRHQHHQQDRRGAHQRHSQTSASALALAPSRSRRSAAAHAGRRRRWQPRKASTPCREQRIDLPARACCRAATSPSPARRRYRQG